MNISKEAYSRARAAVDATDTSLSIYRGLLEAEGDLVVVVVGEIPPRPIQRRLSAALGHGEMLILHDNPQGLRYLQTGLQRWVEVLTSSNPAVVDSAGHFWFFPAGSEED
jgi:hypothetical protein